MAFAIIILVLVALSVVLTLDTSWMNVLQGTRNELVFAKRNKDYGAYELRKEYTRRLAVAMVAGIALFAVVVGTPYLITKMGPEQDTKEMVQIVEVNLDNFRDDQPEEPPPPPEVIVPPQPQIETVQFVAVEASDEPVEAPPPTQEDLSETVASTTTQEGQKIDAPPPPPPPVEEETFDLAAVQEQPEFPGGMGKMYEYLQKNTKYPDMEYDAGIQGKVWVEFVVERSGEVSDVKVRRGVSPGLDKEALRAVRSMPNWNPGKMNGKAVKVRFTIPVDFKLK
ncbi:MAG TPA: TonB family protein [Flavobacteriales bacterium]|nr:TonB family protein [Flavobacteriales bacterium]HRN35477.1 TonB family protein [Flavobacteriales bacterium]HRO38769.1 TonB family protein [Flavobacteriales bacterium]HRP80706.1 TonB family protein [Flavobacteriales bacterium]HRQ84047.1 TonB family protein [Flavobacteriales bacterium]